MVNALKRSEWDVRPIERAIAVSMVEQFHYAGGGSNTGVHYHGLFRRGTGGGPCEGVAWWLPPTKNAARATFGDEWRSVLSLTRLVIRPDAPKNAATFLLGASIRIIKATDKRWRCLLTYADTWRGHTGAIYRASNWEYCGLTAPQPIYVDANGKLTAKKRGPKNLSNADMAALGIKMIGRFAKHKYRLIIRPN